MRILVTGSSGFIARHLVPRLRDEGEEVVALVREGGSPALAGLETFAAPRDLCELDTWPERIDAVVHLGAANPMRGSAAAEDSTGLMRANRDATVKLAQLAATHRVRRFLFLSTANVHRMDGDRPVIEDDAPEPGDLYAASKLSAEDGLREALQGTATSYTILRPPPVYGTGSGGGLFALERLAASRMPLPFAGALDRRSVIAVENLVDAILVALTHPAAANEIFLLADEEPSSSGELVEMMRGARGRPSRLFALPTPLLVLAARAAGKGGLAERLASPFIVDHSKIRLRLGWRPRLSTQDAIGASAAARP